MGLEFRQGYKKVGEIMSFDEFKDEILCGREIEFSCRNESFFLGNGKNGVYLSNVSKNNVQYFSNHTELVEHAKIFNLTLVEIWEEIVIEYIL